MTASAQSTARPDDAAALMGLLREHRDAAASLVTLATSQRQAVDRSSPDALLEILARRQELIDHFVAQQDDLAQRCRAVQSSSNISEADRAAIRELVDSINQQFEQVLERDREDEARLRQDRDALKGALQANDLARQARQAYLTAPGSTNRFADRKG